MLDFKEIHMKNVKSNALREIKTVSFDWGVETINVTKLSIVEKREIKGIIQIMQPMASGQN